MIQQNWKKKILLGKTLEEIGVKSGEGPVARLLPQQKLHNLHRWH